MQWKTDLVIRVDNCIHCTNIFVILHDRHGSTGSVDSVMHCFFRSHDDRHGSASSVASVMHCYLHDETQILYMLCVVIYRTLLCTQIDIRMHREFIVIVT